MFAVGQKQTTNHLLITNGKNYIYSFRQSVICSALECTFSDTRLNISFCINLWYMKSVLIDSSSLWPTTFVLLNLLRESWKMLLQLVSKTQTFFRNDGDTNEAPSAAKLIQIILQQTNETNMSVQYSIVCNVVEGRTSLNSAYMLIHLY